MNLRTAAVAALLALACSKPAPPAAAKSAPPAAPAPAVSPNLLSIQRGAAVVSRTGEADLIHSAVRAIDDDGNTTWLTPPGDPKQSAVFSIGSRVRITSVGAITSSVESAAARSITLDFSDDGEHFANPHTMQLKSMRGEQRDDIAPVDARFVRVTIDAGHGSYVQINDVLLHGSVIAQGAPRIIDGAWFVNRQPASFDVQYNDVRGYVGGDDNTLLEGGSDGHFYRFAWTRGPQYGLAAISVAPDARHLSGLVWHEEAVQAPQFFANDWLGESRGNKPPRPVASVMETYLQRFGYYPLFGLRFADDGTLDLAQSKPLVERMATLVTGNPQLHFRLVAHVLTRGSAQENLAVSQKEIETLRSALAAHQVDPRAIEFVAAGEDHPHREPSSGLTRAMYSSVDLEIRR